MRSAFQKSLSPVNKVQLHQPTFAVSGLAQLSMYLNY